MNVLRCIQHAHHSHACEQHYTSIYGRSTATPTIDKYDSQYGESKDANSRDARGEKLCLGRSKTSLLEEQRCVLTDD